MDKMLFRNFGGLHQFMVGDEGDLARIDELDPARWAATSAPLTDLHCARPTCQRQELRAPSGRKRGAWTWAPPPWPSEG